MQKIIVELPDGELFTYKAQVDFDAVEYVLEQARMVYPDCDIWAEDDWL